MPSILAHTRVRSSFVENEVIAFLLVIGAVIVFRRYGLTLEWNETQVILGDDDDDNDNGGDTVANFGYNVALRDDEMAVSQMENCSIHGGRSTK